MTLTLSGVLSATRVTKPRMLGSGSAIRKVLYVARRACHVLDGYALVAGIAQSLQRLATG